MDRGGVENGTLSCDDSQSITYGPAYRKVHFNLEIHSDSLEDVFLFNNRYVVALYCHGQSMGRAELGILFHVWRVVVIGITGAPLEALEDYLGPDFTDCTRGLIEDARFPGYALCAIVTDKQGVTRFYPLFPDNPVWGNTQNKKIGDFFLTKEELFEWYHNIKEDIPQDRKNGQFLLPEEEFEWHHKIDIDSLDEKAGLY